MWNIYYDYFIVCLFCLLSVDFLHTDILQHSNHFLCRPIGLGLLCSCILHVQICMQHMIELFSECMNEYRMNEYCIAFLKHFKSDYHTILFEGKQVAPHFNIKFMTLKVSWHAFWEWAVILLLHVFTSLKITNFTKVWTITLLTRKYLHVWIKYLYLQWKYTHHYKTTERRPIIFKHQLKYELFMFSINNFDEYTVETLSEHRYRHSYLYSILGYNRHTAMCSCK